MEAVLEKLRGAWQRKQEGKAESEETEGCQALSAALGAAGSSLD